MKTVCASCNKEIKPSFYRDYDIISYGLCKSCKNNLFYQNRVELSKYLNSLPVPIILIDPEKGIKTCNEKACEMLSKKLQEIEGHQPGIVLKCKFSKLPGGCGNTPHCVTCTIRQAIMETFTMGKSFHKIPVILNRENQKINLFVSTEKISGLVFLRIDS